MIYSKVIWNKEKAKHFKRPTKRMGNYTPSWFVSLPSILQPGFVSHVLRFCFSKKRIMTKIYFLIPKWVRCIGIGIWQWWKCDMIDGLSVERKTENLEFWNVLEQIVHKSISPLFNGTKADKNKGKNGKNYAQKIHWLFCAGITWFFAGPP